MASNKKNILLSTLKAFLLVIIILISSFLGAFLATQYQDYSQSQDIVETFSDDEDEFSIDWDSLLAINEDIIAWIRIPDTNISYPVVQGSTNSEYIHKSIYGNYLKAGTIFVDSNISDPFNCANTIIYGHNLGNGTMFSDLRKYKNTEFGNEHNIIYIYFPDDTVLHYKFVSFHVVNSTNTNIYNPYVTDVVDYSDYVFADNYYPDTELKETDRLITLSTCTNWGDTRYVLHAKLIS